MWTGRSDYLDLDGLACHNPIILDRLVYAFGAAMWTKLLFDGIFILKHQYERYKTKKLGGKSRVARQNLIPVINIAITLLIGVPCFIAAFILRQFGNFGVDEAPSYVLFVGVALNLYTSLIAMQMIYETIFKSSLNGSSAEEIRQVIASHRFWNLFATTLHAFNFGICTILSVYMPNGITPYRIAIVVMRNMGSASYYLFLYMDYKFMVKALNKLSADRDAAHNSKIVSSEFHAEIKKAIDHITGTLNKLVLLMGVIVPILFIFTAVPQLYAFNQVPNGIVWALGAGRGNFVHAWGPKKLGKNTSSNRSSSNQANTLRITPGNSKEMTMASKEVTGSKEGTVDAKDTELAVHSSSMA